MISTATMTRPLALTDDELRQAGAWLTDFLRRYEGSLRERPVMPALDRSALAALRSPDMPCGGVGLDRLFRTIDDVVVPNSTAIAHPRFLAYVLGPPTGLAPLAEAVAAALNQNCNFWQLSPAANAIEQAVVGWAAGLYGWHEGAGGHFTSGASMATMTAISAAMHALAGPELRRIGLQRMAAPFVAYTSAEAHGSVEKAVVMLGLGQESLRLIPVDAAGRMRADLLRAAIQRDRRAGLRPTVVVAACGTVTRGAIDPLDDIAQICREHGVWMHVDGAFGALFVLSGRWRARLAAECGNADSLAIDPHKLLAAPLEAGCLLVRDRAALRRAFAFGAPYLGAADDPLLMNYMDEGPQLSRGFKAFKVWCALQAFGTDAFTQAIDRMLDLARAFADRLRAHPRFELLSAVTLNVVCFAIRGATEDETQLVLRRLIDEGTALIGPVRIGDRFGLRLCVNNYRTTMDDVEIVVARINAIAEAIGESRHA
jgi:aromatic-L-amino-acid/L-tryptophan decarboxylase